MPQFVLLQHDHPELHWDFMLESGDVLLTWRLDQIPGELAEIEAQALPDHRKAYLDYEGPVSGDRGSVVRIDRGSFELLKSSVGGLTVRLNGDRVCGEARLRQLSSRVSNVWSDMDMWRMSWLPDELPVP